MRSRKDISASYGRLSVLSVEGGFALCACSCGSDTFKCRVSNLRNGSTKSCGCLRREVGVRTRTHGQTKTNLYKNWQQMLSRCNNPMDKSYTNYGGRGITVCNRWEDSFENFALDVGQRPGPNFSLDRKDNNGPYSPENCRWATKTQQSRNRRCALQVTIGQETKSLKEWCDKFGVNYWTAYGRIKRLGWTGDDAVTTSARIAGLPNKQPEVA